MGARIGHAAVAALRAKAWDMGHTTVDASDALKLIEAALPHLTGPVEPTTESFRRGVAIGRAEAPRADDIRVDAAYQRGVAAERDAWEKRITQSDLAEPIQGEAITCGPSDYELWRDAWNLAAANTPQDASTRDLRDNAEWFHGQLKRGAPGPPIPNCEHCGADSSMDHDDDCPNAWEGTPGPVTPIEPSYQVLDTYPGHDMRETIGGCRPDSPCPACQERVHCCPHCGADPTTPIPETHAAGCPNEPNGE